MAVKLKPLRTLFFWGGGGRGAVQGEGYEGKGGKRIVVIDGG